MASFVFSGVTYSAPVEGTTNFALTSDEGNAIGYLSQEHIHVYNSADGETWIQYVQGAGYAFNAEGTEIILVTPTVAGQQIRILRNTPMSAQYVTFSDGSLLTSNQLNKAELFSLYCDQELSDGIKAIDDGGLDGRYVRVTGDNMTGNLTLGTDKITLDVDGSAAFAGTVNVNDEVKLFSNGSANFNGGTVKVNGLGRILVGAEPDNYDTGKTILNEDGSAAFNNRIDLNGGVYVDGGASMSTGFYYRDDSTSNGLSFYNGPANQTNRTVFIKTDGSAAFAGGKMFIESGGETVARQLVTVSDPVNPSGASGKLNYYHLKLTDSSSSTTCEVVADTGQAKFLSDKSNIELNNDYALQVYRKSNKDNDTGFALFSNYQTIGRKQIEFYTNGSALFRGMVEAQQGIKFGDGSVQTTAGGGGGGGATVTVSDTAPVGQKQGDLWWDSLGAALYLWYVDPDVDEQWVPATPTAGDIAQTYVKKAGDTMTGNLKVGGDNNFVNVKADGGITAIDQTNDQCVWINNSAPGAIIINDVNSTTNGKTVLNADGSAEFAQQVTAKDYVGKQTDDTFPVYRALSADGNSTTFRVNANGSATFAGGATEISSSGAILVNRAAGTNDVFTGQLNDSVTSNIEADGSATFAGGELQIFASGSIRTNGQLYVSDTIQLNADGSAMFAGGADFAGVDLSSASASGQHLDKDGWMAIQRPDGNAGAGLEIYAGTSQNAALKADGSATFAGNVTANGSILTRSTGDINVGDRLEQAQETFQKLRAAVDNATDFAQLKAAMQAALSGFEPGLEAGGLK